MIRVVIAVISLGLGVALFVHGLFVDDTWESILYFSGAVSFATAARLWVEDER